MNVILRRIPPRFKTILGLMICCMVGIGLSTPCFSAPASTESPEVLSAQEKQSLVQQGVEQYKQGKHGQAQRDLELARTLFPENYAAPYYLGLIYLEKGKRSAAIAQWRQYVAMDPDSENALRIRKNLTLLLRQEARDSAKQAVTYEAAMARLPADENTVAISAFNSMGSEDIKPLGKGMAALLIHDLSQVPDLQVVERVRLQALLQEMKLGTSGLVSAETAPRVGKLLKAKHVTSGSLADLEKESLQIASEVMDADEMASIGTQQAQGQLKQFYELEKQIACQIIEDLDRSCEEVPAAFHKVHTKSLAALILFATGLDYLDQEKYDQARESFQNAIEQDPSFELAQDTLMATPSSATMPMNKSQMISSTASSGPSAIVSATAVATSSAPGIAAAAEGGTVGFTPTTAILAGTAVVGGGAALASGGSDGGGSSGGGTPSSLTGDWEGIWTNSVGESGDVTLSLTQTGDTISGMVSIPGDECLPMGDVSGTVSGTSVNMTVQSGPENVTVNATVSTSTLSGTWSYTSSAFPSECIDTGSFSAELITP